jgi:hypothetical protein
MYVLLYREMFEIEIVEFIGINISCYVHIFIQ